MGEAKEQYTQWLPRRWLAGVLALLAVALFIWLGIWQLERAEYKGQILSAHDRQRAQPRVSLLHLLQLPPAQHAWHPVRLQGRFLPGQYFLLDNSIRSGRVGYEVLQPFRSDEGLLVLINRGWVLGSPYRQQLPEVPAVKQRVSVEAVATAPALGEMAVQTEDREQGWPRVVQAVRLASLQRQLGEDLVPLVLRLESTSPGALLAQWPTRHIDPDRHRAYALQWFSFAFLVPVLLFFAARRAPLTKGDKP